MRDETIAQKQHIAVFIAFFAAAALMLFPIDARVQRAHAHLFFSHEFIGVAARNISSSMSSRTTVVDETRALDRVLGSMRLAERATCLSKRLSP